MSKLNLSKVELLKMGGSVAMMTGIFLYAGYHNSQIKQTIQDEKDNCPSLEDIHLFMNLTTNGLKHFSDVKGSSVFNEMKQIQRQMGNSEFANDLNVPLQEILNNPEKLANGKDTTLAKELDKVGRANRSKYLVTYFYDLYRYLTGDNYALHDMETVTNCMNQKYDDLRYKIKTQRDSVMNPVNMLSHSKILKLLDK